MSNRNIAESSDIARELNNFIYMVFTSCMSNIQGILEEELVSGE